MSTAPDPTIEALCERCGPFPAANVVVTPPSLRKVWVRRAAGTLLVLAAAAVIALTWNDSSGAVFSAVAAMCTLVGLNLWRLSRDATRICPTCGSARVIDGDSRGGRYRLLRWRMAHR